MDLNTHLTKVIGSLMLSLVIFITNAQSFTGFTLVDATSDTSLIDLNDGDVINLREFSTTSFNILVDTEGAIESVSFFLNNVFERIENVTPYALKGDRSGDYYDWNPPLGLHVFEAFAYSSSGGNGTLLDSVSVTITFIDEPLEIPVTNISFINCPTESLVDGDEIDLDVVIEPSNATNQDIFFTASYGGRVTSQNGVFTADIPGEFTVTATSLSNPSVSAECVIIVEEAPPTIDPYQIVQGEDYTGQQGTRIGGSGIAVGYIQNNDYIFFEDVNFDQSTFAGSVRASSDRVGGTIEWRTGGVSGELLATSTITNTGGWSTFEQFPITLVNPGSAQGIVDLYLVFKGGSGYLFDVDEFFFTAEEILVTSISFVNCPTEPLKVGDTLDLDVLIEPANATNQTIAFTASDGTSVDYLSGEFIASSPGEITVTATSFSDGNVFDQCVITVLGDSTSRPPTITGEMKKWHKVTLSFEGPDLSETSQENPFADYRLNVTFSNGAKSYTVPGFYAADGNAANTSATSGNIWQVHFSPDEIGTWTYTASFRTGTDIAISTNASDGTATSFDGQTGTFEISPTDKIGRDFRATGRLAYVGEHYLQFAETGDFFFKVGADAPENTFAYEDFDGTPNRGGRRKSWSFHAGDFDLSDAADYTWGDPQPDGARENGRELLGAVKYLSDEGMNVFSFLTFSLQGDDDNVFPHLQRFTDAFRYNEVYHDRYDVSKLDQWEKVLEYADKKGMYLHFKTQETENDLLMDGGQLGRERKLYYRELIARFGHHLALNWNLGEENDIWEELSDPDNTLLKSYADYIKDIDPYDHNIVIHTYVPQQDEVYSTLLGSSSELTGASIQTGIENVHSDVKRWVQNSRSSGKKWVVANDEQGDHRSGVTVDASYPDSQLPEPRDKDDNRAAVRHQVLWGTMLAGGAGVEYYYGYQTGCDDLGCQDHRTRATKWADGKIAIDFFNTYLQQHVLNMVSNDSLTTDNGDYVFADEGEIYVIYRPSGGTSDLNLASQSGSFEVKWYDPRDGGALQDGSVTSIAGGGSVSLGLPPSDTSNDWVAVVTKDESAPLRVLVYHETAGFRHGSISAGIQMIEDFGTSNGWVVENSQVSDIFNTENLATADVVVWLNTSGNGLLTSSEQAAFESYIQNGGGFVGVHAATDTYRNGSWPWYNELVGAIVQTSPNHTSNNFNATMDVVGSHPAVSHLGTEWNKNEEYYYWELNGGFLFSGNIDLLTVRSTGSQSYDAPRPITWYKEYDGGRSFYTALGHNGSDYSSNADFITMMEQAILWAAGDINISSARIANNQSVDIASETSNELALEAFIVYPNPVEDILTLRSSKSHKINVIVTSLDGKKMLEGSGTGVVQLDLETTNAGIYVLHVEEGGLTKTIKIKKK